MDNRVNILKWYPFKENDKVLEIYNEYSILDKIGKKLDLQQISIDQIKIKEKYDFITLIGTYEYAPLIIKTENSYRDLLKMLREHLNDDGKILIAIDNRIGVKYFVGGKSRYDSRLFEGLETKINLSKPNLLLKNELIKFIEQADFKNYKFYYPLPDYKNTSSIFTDNFLPQSNHSKIVYPLNYEDGSKILYNEINVMKQICNIQQFENFANSYLIEIGNKEIKNDIKFVNYNIFRKNKYQLLLIMHNNFVEKIPSNNFSISHVKQIFKYIDNLYELGFNVLEKKEDEKIISEFITEKELDKKITELIKNGKKQEAYNEITKWYNYISTRLIGMKSEVQDAFQKYNLQMPNEIKEKMKFIKDGFIDLTFENVFCKDEYLFYDQEWYLENIPLEFILYRAINNLYAYNNVELEQEISKKEILKKFNLAEYIPYFEQLEHEIQNEILDENSIKEYREKEKRHYISIENMIAENKKQKEEIKELKEEYQKLSLYNEKIIEEKENVQKLYNKLLYEYNTSRGWKIIKGFRKIIGRKEK